MRVLKDKLHWFLAGALVLLLLCVIVEITARRLRREAVSEAEVP